MPYEVGMARFSEIARGHITGDTAGMLKLLFHRETRKLLGVHVIGESATEIVHIGQAVMALGGTIDYFRDTVFNYPTMAECYKVAALDGLNKLSLWAEAESDVRRDRCRRSTCERQIRPAALACGSAMPPAQRGWQTASVKSPRYMPGSAGAHSRPLAASAALIIAA